MNPERAEIEELTRRMAFRGPADDSVMWGVIGQLGGGFAPEYFELMNEHNGCKGPVGDHGFAEFFPMEELEDLQERYYDCGHMPGWVAFGTGKNGEVFCFDEDGYVCPRLDGSGDYNPQGSFIEFLRRLGAGGMCD